MDISATIHLLGDILGQVLSEQESPALFEIEERIRLHAKARRGGEASAAQALTAEIGLLAVNQAWAIASAFALYFDLVNLAEENDRVNSLRTQEATSQPLLVPDSIGEAIAILHQQGVSQEEMAEILGDLSVELVLTAHPTEAKRRSILSKLHRIASILRQVHQPDLLPRELEEMRQALHAEVTAFWLTDRARTVKPDVLDEVRTNLFFVEEYLWTVLPRIYKDLNTALAQYYPGLAQEQPWLRLASWVGGDRDGNPYVTTEVTAETLRLHRGLAVETFRRSFQEAARRLSLSSKHIPPPPELQAWFESRRPLPEHVAYLENRYATEPYRLVMSLLADNLAQASRDDMTARLLSDEPQEARMRLQDLSIPLDIIYRAIPSSVADEYLSDLRLQLKIFHLLAARLDIREDASVLRATVGEVLRALNIQHDFEEAAPEVRTALLTRLLGELAPTLARHPGVTYQTAEILALFQVIARSSHIYGPELLGPFIISMTSSPADVLAVLLLACWMGCADCLSIVPLFETVADLEAAPRILDELFSLEAYRSHLKRGCQEQMVMIGYSDSNKDGGYLAANWALYQAQENIARVCQQHGIKLTLFHGRGGTVARGGGPANRAIRAQPPGTINGRFRLTEQGEIISSRYSNPVLAHRHLEQIVNAVLLASASPQERFTVPQMWRQAMAEMVQAAHAAYRTLVFETPRFLDFWQSATPIDEINRLRIGSRPASRQSGVQSVQKMRAIPWVFSWMQSRFNLPGWYGLGNGIAAFLEQTGTGALGLLQEMYASWPFFQSLLDNAESSLLKADMGIARLYAELVPDAALSGQIFAQILGEYELTHRVVLQVTRHQYLMDSDPLIQRSVSLRNPYVDPLNYIQVEMLRRLRQLEDPESPEAQDLREVVVSTINGIASALRNTG